MQGTSPDGEVSDTTNPEGCTDRRRAAGFLGPTWTYADRLERERLAVEQLKRLLPKMELPPIDEAARQRLQRLIYWHGPEHVTLLIRTITESEGNEGALVEPVISAMSSVMSSHRDWTFIVISGRHS